MWEIVVLQNLIPKNMCMNQERCPVFRIFHEQGMHKRVKHSKATVIIDLSTCKKRKRNLVAYKVMRLAVTLSPASEKSASHLNHRICYTFHIYWGGFCNHTTARNSTYQRTIQRSCLHAKFGLPNNLDPVKTRAQKALGTNWIIPVHIFLIPWVEMRAAKNLGNSKWWDNTKRTEILQISAAFGTWGSKKNIFLLALNSSNVSLSDFWTETVTDAANCA